MNVARKPSICAIIAVRNEICYLQFLLPFLARQDIEVVIIDNGSTDGSEGLCEMHKGNPVIAIERVPYHGFFSLSDLLSAEQDVAGRLKHDWLVHHDADEIMEHCTPGLTLRDAIEQADDGGFDVLNFDEFVFLPEPGSNYLGKDYYSDLLRYYFFAPQPNRLNRAWKRTANLDNLQTAGHILEGKPAVAAPGSHILRHYIVLSQEHALRKYLHRTFDPRETAWHANRRNFTRGNLMLPGENDALFQLENAGSRNFRKDAPLSRHFWEWNKT